MSSSLLPRRPTGDDPASGGVAVPESFLFEHPTLGVFPHLGGGAPCRDDRPLSARSLTSKGA